MTLKHWCGICRTWTLGAALAILSAGVGAAGMASAPAWIKAGWTAADGGDFQQALKAWEDGLLELPADRMVIAGNAFADSRSLQRALRARDPAWAAFGYRDTARKETTPVYRIAVLPVDQPVRPLREAVESRLGRANLLNAGHLSERVVRSTDSAKPAPTALATPVAAAAPVIVAAPLPVAPAALPAAASATGAVKPAPTSAIPAPATLAAATPRQITLAMRETPIAEVFDMLARSEKVNIVLGKGVTGNISVSLHDVTLEQAVRAAAEAGGYVAERRGNAWLVVDRKDLGMEEPTAETGLATHRLLYAPAQKVADILTKHLSRYGKVTPLIERSMVVVEDRPEVLAKLAALVRTLDVEPRQILLEAQILEIKLDKSETFGVDWRRIFAPGEPRSGSFGVGGLVSNQAAGTANNALGTLTGKNSPEFFATIAGRRFTAYLSALAKDGRVNTLSTPRLLVMEGQQAQTQIGTQTGYKVTTTINQVTTESIQFLDAGVILRVTPSVDANNRVVMKLQPEVSSVAIIGGLPNKATTQVTTNVIANDGETVFIGGLIKGNLGRTKQGIPVLHDLPVVGNLFGMRSDEDFASETVVLITPRLIAPGEGGGVEFVPSEATRDLMEKGVGRVTQTRPLDLPPTPPGQ